MRALRFPGYLNVRVPCKVTPFFIFVINVEYRSYTPYGSLIRSSNKRFIQTRKLVDMFVVGYLNTQLPRHRLRGGHMCIHVPRGILLPLHIVTFI